MNAQQARKLGETENLESEQVTRAIQKSIHIAALHKFKETEFALTGHFISHIRQNKFLPKIIRSLQKKGFTVKINKNKNKLKIVW